MFSTFPVSNFNFSFIFILLSAIAFNLDQSKFLSFGEELKSYTNCPARLMESGFALCSISVSHHTIPC